MGKVYSMVIKYLDSKRISTVADSATSVQGYSTLSAGTNGWSVGTGAADGTLLSLQVVSGSALIGDPIQNIKVTLYKNSSPDQLVYVRVRNSSNVILAEASKQASTLTGSATEYVFTLDTGVILSSLDRVNVEYYGASGTGTVGIEVLNNAGTSTVNCQRDTATVGVYADIARRPSWQFDSSPSTAISILQSKPTNVQDNSILVEKDTGSRFWFSAGGTTGSDINLQTNTATGTGGGSNPNTIMACKSLTELTAGDQISKIGFDAQATSNQPYGGMRLVLYTDNSGTPATLIGYTANLDPSGTGWFEGTLVGGDHTITASEAGHIWIGIWGNASVAYFKETLSSGIKQMTQTFASSGAPNTTFSVDTTHNSEFKARLTYKDGTLATWTWSNETVGDRGIFACGLDVLGVAIQSMDYINIATLANASDFGDLITANSSFSGASNSTRGVWFGGLGNITDISYTTIETKGDSLDFGDLTVGTSTMGACASEDRSVRMGGWDGTRTNVMDYITIATLGNATDFGDLTVGRSDMQSLADATRGVGMGGYNGSILVTMDYVTIASAGNATNFGDLTNARHSFGTANSDTRGVMMGGGNNATTIDYITIASAGNATAFGSLDANRIDGVGNSSSTRGVTAGGSSDTNLNIEYLTIATTGNSINFGDLTQPKRNSSAGGVYSFQPT